MEHFRQIGEVLGSMKALIVLQDDNQINKRQCCLLFDMFTFAFRVLTEEIKQNLKLEERNTKWKALEQPLKELHKVFIEGELYMMQCLDLKDWGVKALLLHNNHDCVQFHIQNLLSSFPVAVEAIETTGEFSGVDIEDMKKKRIMLANKYDETWNDPKLFQCKFGKQYLISEEICHRMKTVWKEDQWFLLGMIKERKTSSLSKQERQLCNLLVKKIEGVNSLYSSSILTAAKDYQVRRRLGWGSQYKEIQWLGESFSLRHFYVENNNPLMNSEISTLLSLSHPNVVEYLCGFHDEEKNEYFLVMELMNKDLHSYIKEVCSSKRQVPFSLSSSVDIMLQIARGMEYLHSKKIYHGNINPSNVVIKTRTSSSDVNYSAKIMGFGLRDVKATSSRNSSPTRDETLDHIWYAPEVLAAQESPARNKYSEKADVYSFGMLCFELLTGKVPFKDGHLQGDKMGRNIRAGERPLFPFPLPKCLSNVIKKCWQTDPNQRPSFSSICRIIRYVRKLITMNPRLAHPETPSVAHVDFCEIEVEFLKKFPSAADLTPVSQIPFQMFSYRLAEREKFNSRVHTCSDTNSEVVSSSHIDEAVKVLDGSSSPAGSVCSEMTERKNSGFRKVNGFSKDDNYTSDQDTMGSLEKKVSSLRRVNSNTGGRRLLQKTLSPLRRCSSFDQHANTMSVCSETPKKKASGKKFSLLSRSNTVKDTKDAGQQKWLRKGLPMSSPRSQSTRLKAEVHQPISRSSSRSNRKQTATSMEKAIHK